ncbi:MAG: AAA family ATPase [Phormidesmis sp. RL_2_1]|nr:AAA family ATPase [Phormidesmis sp. RL_2_1]
MRLQDIDFPLQALLAAPLQGVFVISGLLDDAAKRRNLHQEISNAFYTLKRNQRWRYVVLLSDSIDVSLSLYPLLPVIRLSPPSKSEIADIVSNFLLESQRDLNNELQRQLVQAFSGMPYGEIDVVLRQMLSKVSEGALMPSFALGYKREKLKGRGITLPAGPDIDRVAGMDELDKTMDKIRLLFQPEAEARGRRPPKAVLLWGIPGTGKSLAAKLSAKRIGGAMVAADWNSLVGQSVQESMANINHLLDLVDSSGTCVLFFDEFEKAFHGWDSGVQGGVLGKMAGRLLSWMQDHTSDVVMIATINRLNLLPAEMIRRFEYVHFFGSIHAGALHEVFKVHLDKHFKYNFSFKEWQILLREYRGCTPAEVAKAVQHVADDLYFRDVQSGDFTPELPQLELAMLTAERRTFTPASSQREISDQIAEIQNMAEYAKPVCGPDQSDFAVIEQPLMGIPNSGGTQKTKRAV